MRSICCDEVAEPYEATDDYLRRCSEPVLVAPACLITILMTVHGNGSDTENFCESSWRESGVKWMAGVGMGFRKFL